MCLYVIGQTPPYTINLKSLLHDSEIKRHVETYLLSLECAHRRTQLRNARMKKQNRNYIPELPQLIRASKLAKYVNQTLLPDFWKPENIRKKAEKLAAELNVTDAEEIDEIYCKIMKHSTRHSKICVRTAQNWLNELGYRYKKHGSHGQFMDYISRFVEH